MQKSLFAAVAMLAALPPLAMAQTNGNANASGPAAKPPAAASAASNAASAINPANNNTTMAAAPADNASAVGTENTSRDETAAAMTSGRGHLGIRRELTANLQQAGFHDVKVVPDSFLVQAKDKSGNPVTMFITPNGMTEIAAVGTANAGGRGDEGQVANANPGAARQNTDTATNATASSEMFADVPMNPELGSKIIGLHVYNDADKDIGTVKDIVLGDRGVRAYIIGVGGFLGMGDHNVAVRPSAVNLSYDAGNQRWHALLNATAAQLKAAPEYKFSNG